MEPKISRRHFSNTFSYFWCLNDITLLLLLLSHFSQADSVRPHRRQPTRLLCPWDSPGKNTGVGCHFLLQCMKMKSESEVAQSSPTLSDSMDCSPPGSSVHGIFQARVLEWLSVQQMLCENCFICKYILDSFVAKGQLCILLLLHLDSFDSSWSMILF